MCISLLDGLGIDVLFPIDASTCSFSSGGFLAFLFKEKTWGSSSMFDSTYRQVVHRVINTH
jgi:hypothetical protein